MAEKVKDPICGMDIEPKQAAAKTEYQGKTYYFCSLGCKTAFEKTRRSTRRSVLCARPGWR